MTVTTPTNLVGVCTEVGTALKNRDGFTIDDVIKSTGRWITVVWSPAGETLRSSSIYIPESLLKRLLDENQTLRSAQILWEMTEK